MAIVALFTYCITSGSTDDPNGYTVDFTNASTGGPTSRLWSFGDGVISVLTSPTHTYKSAGPHTVTLQAFSTVAGWTVRSGAGTGTNKEVKQTSSVHATPALAYAALTAASFGPDATNLSPRYTLSNIPNYQYTARKRTVTYDLTADGAKDIAVLQWVFDGLAANNIIAAEGGLKTDTGLNIRPRFDELSTVFASPLWLGFGDVSGALGTSLVLDFSDLEDLSVPHTEVPASGETTGYISGVNNVHGEGRVRVADISDTDSTSEVIVSIAADFLANNSAVAIWGDNILNVDLADQTTKTPTSWSWRKRRSNTVITVAPSNPEQKSAPPSLPNSIFTTHPNITSLVITDEPGTTTYNSVTDYDIIDEATGEISILDSAGISPLEVLKLSYISADPWVEFSTLQNPTGEQFDKESP